MKIDGLLKKKRELWQEYGDTDEYWIQLNNACQAYFKDATTEEWLAAYAKLPLDSIGMMYDGIMRERDPDYDLKNNL